MYNPCHPSQPRLTSIIQSASRMTLALTELNLFWQPFSSATDVLRLLSLFPRLSNVRLWACVTLLGSRFEAILPPPSTHLTSVRITRYRTDNVDTVLESVSLAQWWQWPHPATDTKVGPYPGLHQTDARTLFMVLQSVHTQSQRASSTDELLFLKDVQGTMEKGFSPNSCTLNARFARRRDLIVVSQGYSL